MKYIVSLWYFSETASHFPTNYKEFPLEPMSTLIPVIPENASLWLPMEIPTPNINVTYFTSTSDGQNPFLSNMSNLVYYKSDDRVDRISFT